MRNSFNPLFSIYSTKINPKKIILYSLILIIISCGYAKKSPTIEFVLDPENKLSIVDVVQNYNGSFQNVKDNSINLGYYDGALWIRLKGIDLVPDNYFEIDNPNLTDIHYYSLNPRESIAYEKIGGRYISSVYKDISHKNQIFQIDKKSDLEYYFRIKSNTPINFHINILDLKNLLYENMYLDIQYGIFIGSTLFILVFLINLLFIKNQYNLFYLILFLIFTFISFYEKWMVFPYLSFSYNFDTSFFDYGLEPLIYICLILFSYYLLEIRNNRLFLLSLVVPTLTYILLFINKFELYFYTIKSFGVILGIYIFILIILRYKRTNHFSTFLFTSWFIIILQFIFELWNYRGKVDFINSITINLVFLFLESCFFILCIHFQESPTSSLNFDPSMYIQTEPEFIPNEDVQILENVDYLISKENIQSIILNNVFDIKLNLICQYHKISDDSKIDFFYNSQLDYLSKYPELKFSIQKIEANYILVFFHSFDKTEVFIRDFYIFNHYLEKSTNNKIFYGLDQLDIQFQYNKKFDIICYPSQIFRNIKLLTDISTKVNLGLLSFFDFQISEEPNHKKRFIGKIKNNNNDAINVWEYHFLKTNSDYFDYFTKGLNFYKKKNYNSALELFQNALEVNPNDEISKLFLKKTQVKIEPTIKSKEGEDLFLLS
jgi:hypothetical protein